MFISTFCNASRGQTTLETLKVGGNKEAKRYICIPSNRLDNPVPVLDEVFAVDWNERIYDLGFKENWRAISAGGGYRQAGGFCHPGSCADTQFLIAVVHSTRGQG